MKMMMMMISHLKRLLLLNMEDALKEKVVRRVSLEQPWEKFHPYFLLISFQHSLPAEMGIISSIVSCSRFISPDYGKMDITREGEQLNVLNIHSSSSTISLQPVSIVYSSQSRSNIKITQGRVVEINRISISIIIISLLRAFICLSMER
jgi:hypothetical protein